MTPTDTQVGDQWGDLEEKAKASRDLCADAKTPSGLSWITARELRAYEPEDAAFIAAADPATVLELIAAARAVGTSNASEPEQKPHPIRGEGELLPCPFCGGPEHHRFNDPDEFGRPSHGVQCANGNCWIVGPQCETAEEAQAAWNRRAHPPTSYGKGEELRTLLQEVIDDRNAAWCQECSLVQEGGDLRNRILQALQSAVREPR